MKVVAEMTPIENWILNSLRIMTPKEVAKELGILTKSRKREIKEVRWLFWNWLRKNSTLSYKVIGEITGHDHATVIFGFNKFDFEQRYISLDKFKIVKDKCECIDPIYLVKGFEKLLTN